MASTAVVIGAFLFATGPGQRASAEAPVPPVVPTAAPAPPLDVYARAAATCPGLPSNVLAAIHQVESSGQDWAPMSSAGAIGPMQFMPNTWQRYGTDGDGDGDVDVHHPVDAVFGAARLLCANGGADPERLPSAVYRYNHSYAYVHQVLSKAGVTPGS